MGGRFLKFVKNTGALALFFFLSTAAVLILNSIAAYFIETPELRSVDEMYTEFPDHTRDMLRYYRRIHNDFNYVEIYLDFLGFDLLGPYPPEEYNPEHVANAMRFLEKIRAEEAVETPWYLKIWDLLEHPLLSRDKNTRNTPDRSAATATKAIDFVIVEFNDLAPTTLSNPNKLSADPTTIPALTVPANASAGNAVLFSLTWLVMSTVFVTLSAAYLGTLGICYIFVSALAVVVLVCGATFPHL